jgi:hypothetical protein
MNFKPCWKKLLRAMRTPGQSYARAQTGYGSISRAVVALMAASMRVAAPSFSRALSMWKSIVRLDNRSIVRFRPSRCAARGQPTWITSKISKGCERLCASSDARWSQRWRPQRKSQPRSSDWWIFRRHLTRWTGHLKMNRHCSKRIMKVRSPPEKNNPGVSDTPRSGPSFIRMRSARAAACASIHVLGASR